VTRLFRLLEIIRQRARVDAQDPDLARRLLAGIARRRLELGLEVLRQTEADRLLRIAAAVKFRRVGSSANANAESTVDPGA